MADVNYKIGADATAVVQEIGKVRKSLTGLGKLRWSELAMGVQAVMANPALLKNAAVGRLTPSLSPPTVRNASVFSCPPRPAPIEKKSPSHLLSGSVSDLLMPR